MERLFTDLVNNLASTIETNNKSYEFIKSFFNSLNEDEKKLFTNYIKSILDDCSSTILGGLDGITDMDLYPCDEITLYCCQEKIQPWVHELFIAIVQENQND